MKLHVYYVSINLMSRQGLFGMSNSTYPIGVYYEESHLDWCHPGSEGSTPARTMTSRITALSIDPLDDRGLLSRE
jgi:hypothetical protein